MGCQKLTYREELPTLKVVKGIFSNEEKSSAGIYRWGFLTVDLTDGVSFYTLGKPITLNCRKVLSYSNYYLDEEISITDMASKKQLVLGIEGWTTSEFKHTDTEFYFKLQSVNQCEVTYKYIKIKT